MEDIKSSISQTGNMAKFTVKRYPVDSNADRIKATFRKSIPRTLSTLCVPFDN